MSGVTIVEYAIFCPNGIDIRQFMKDCQIYCDSLIDDYIWQHDGLVFNTCQTEYDTGLPCIKGQSNIGENINDEWFIVYLMFELSKKFVNSIIQISDDDGEFLLAEAADKLPSWLKPDSSENRVFIHKGKLHIIPIPSSPAEITIYPTAKPTLQQAYHLITEGHRTCATEGTQQLILSRINEYPGKMKTDFHYSHCYIPEEIVYILKENPSMISAAVQAFYERDPLDVKICKKMKTFKPSNRLLAKVKFTRHLYSQISQANFSPERNSPWRLPPCIDRLYKASALGYKLTCGFEILLASHSQGSKDTEPSGRRWQKYLNNLKKNDFFQNELEGSKHYMELLEQAEIHYHNHFTNEHTSTDELYLMLQSLIKEADKHRTEIRKSCENLEDEDSDDWMTVSPEELDEMMRNMWSKNNGSNLDKRDTDNLTNLVSSMKSFVDNISSYEGAELPAATADDAVDDGIKFDPERFMESVRNLLEPSAQSTNVDDSSDFDTDYDDDSCDELSTNFVEDPIIKKVMNDMDDELKTTSIPKSFHGVDETDEGQVVDMDVNLIKNFLESFSSQDGLAGPVSSMLHSMGMTLPPDDGT